MNEENLTPFVRGGWNEEDLMTGPRSYLRSDQERPSAGRRLERMQRQTSDSSK